MGTRAPEVGAGTQSEFSETMKHVESAIAMATPEDIHSVVDIVKAFSKLSKDSELLCPGNWDRQLSFKSMEREASRLALFALASMVGHGR